MMKQIEEDKPEGWGLKKMAPGEFTAGGDEADQMNAYSHNMNKAIKKIELQEKIDSMKKQQNLSEEEKRKMIV